MSAALRLEPDGPPVGRLALLALVVLGLHLALLSGWPGNSSPDDLSGFGQLDVPDLGQAARQDRADTAPPPPSPHARSSVRWLLLPPPEPPAPPAPPPSRVVTRTPVQPTAQAQPVAPGTGTEAEPGAGNPYSEGDGLPAGLIEPGDAAEAPATDDLARTGQASLETAPPLASAEPQQGLRTAAPVPTDRPPGTAEPTAQDTAPETSSEAGTERAAIPAFRTRGLPQAKVPGSARLEYDVSGQAKGLNYQASGTLEWEHDDLDYQAQMRVSAFMLGSRTQRSTGRLDATGLHPDRFLDISRREQETRFDSERERIAYVGHAHEDPLHAGAQDRLSVILQLAARFNAAMPAAGQRLHLQVAGASGTEPWEFEVVGQEEVTVPAGGFTAWHVRRVARHRGDAATSVWLAPSLEHLPVRLVITQPNGDRLEQALRRLP